MRLRFWGARGSIPTPGAGQARYGGNTPCLEVACADSQDAVVIDCGTGGRGLGDHILARSNARRIHVLLTHFHWDHIQGIPFFAPLFDPKREIIFYANLPADEISNRLKTQMSNPFWPIGLENVPAQVGYHSIVCGTKFGIGAMLAESFPLRHPQGAVGYRLSSGGAVLVHASDHEVGDPKIDGELTRASQGADFLILDAQYTPEEYASREGWGHSSYAHAAAIANAANVDRLALFHHDPVHDDSFLDDMLSRAKELSPNVSMAREGEVIEI